MEIHPSRSPGRRLTGLVLIVVGATFFLDQCGFIAVQDLWHYWPLMLVVVGVVRMAEAPHARDLIGGAWSILIGLWLFANFEGWSGMDFDNSWPVLLVAWGITLVFSPVVKKDHHHAP